MYFNSINDHHGFTHSIDNIIVDYYLLGNYKFITDKLIELLNGFGFDVEKGAKLDKLPSSRYEFYTNHLWYDGFHFSLGKWDSYDDESKKWLSLDMMRFKVNPNKHGDTPLFKAVLEFLREYCTSGCLIRYDYAVDVPVGLKDVLVISSRKEPGLYKGTRYYGQRHKHGYLKIYDKAKEAGLDDDRTRIEYTFVSGHIPSIDNIVIRAPVETSESHEELSGQLSLYLDMLIHLKSLSVDITQYLERMNYRTLKKIEPYLFSGIKLDFDETVLNKLINFINDTFIITETNEPVNDSPDEFMTCFDTDLPFD